MMIHEKLISGQFLFDLKNDRSSMLHAHHQQHQQQQHSPPMTANKMDIYSAYAYQQQLQQQLLSGVHHQHHHPAMFNAPSVAAPSSEVLDLSRRCDSVETPRKTPSPYQSTSSFGSGSPSGSPMSCQQLLQQHSATAGLIPANLLYSAQAQQPLNTDVAASLYPALYYSKNVKQEAVSPPPQAALHTQAQQLPTAAATSLLQTFASAAAAASAASAMQIDVQEPHSPIYQPAASTKTRATTPTSSTATGSALSVMQDSKTTRPFKAFPRDPLVIAANFAATDVMLDNPRGERYTEYRKRVLEQIRSSNGGTRTITNPKMRRTNSRSGSIHDGSSNNNSESEERNGAEESSDCDSNAGNFDKLAEQQAANGGNIHLNASGCGSQQKDAAYYERRRKNNAAAKKSRDRRRIKEDEIAIRAAYLERQNIELLCQIDSLKAQLASFAGKPKA